MIADGSVGGCVGRRTANQLWNVAIQQITHGVKQLIANDLGDKSVEMERRTNRRLTTLSRTLRVMSRE
jgi:hypothetical protein